ncbi:MAG TPA: type IV secretion system protein [Candidatus Angelobacter sp.]|nr:type IV secretion system protein [Candidatus Angelobacter sp.]
MLFHSLLDSVRNDIAGLFAQNAFFFTALGMNLFRGFATILIVWVGVKNALNAASGGPGLDFGVFADFVLVLSFGYAMTHYYSVPIPGIGTSFYHLITDQAFMLADRIGQQPINELVMKLEGYVQAASALRLLTMGPGYFFYSIFLMLIFSVVELLVFAIIAFGYIAIGVLTLIGPIFIPFFIVPKMDFLFWGWLKSFFQYAFYPVIANAFLWVLAKLMLQLLGPLEPQSFSDMAHALAMLPFLTVVVGAGIYGILKIPVLVNHVFSGSSGEGGGGAVQTAATMAVRAAL